jgi:IclR family KDG regulon transcriptional repressor
MVNDGGQEGAAGGYADAVQIRAVRRAVELVRTLGERPQGASVSELATALRMPKSSVYRLLATLRRADWVAFEAETERYRLGLGLLETSAGVLASLSLRDLAQPHLEAIWRASNESVHLGLIHGTHVVYAMKYESTHSVRMFSEVGKSAPLYCTGLGKALLAWMPAEERAALVAALEFERFTPHTLTTPAALEADLATARERGYVVDNAEHEDFVRCVAAPILSPQGVVGSISIAGPLNRMTDERLSELGPLVRSHCAELSAAVANVSRGRLRA